MDNKNLNVAEFPTSKNKRSLIYYDGTHEIKSKNKIIIIPFCDSGLFTPDIRIIEQELLLFAKEKKIQALENNCIHIIKTIKKLVYHGFCII